MHPLLNTSDEFELDIALIHFAHSLIQVRLSCFADLVHACPNVVKKLFGQRQRLNIDEMVRSLFYSLSIHWSHEELTL